MTVLLFLKTNFFKLNNLPPSPRPRGTGGQELTQAGFHPEQEIQRLMQEHGDYLKRLCFLYLRDEAAAEDAAQETFLKVYRALSDFRGDSSEKTWISRIAINTCRDFRRAAWFRLVDPQAVLENIPAPDDDFAKTDDTVLKEIMALPRKYKELILLRYYQNLSLKEVGEALDLSVSTASTRLKRARELLKKRLKGWYFNED